MTEALDQLYLPGDVVDGRYRIISPLSHGGMGGIYLAEQRNFGRRVALKVLLRSEEADNTSRQRFVREAKAVCHLQHPNLVIYHDFGTDPETGRLYLIMEYLQGRSLSEVLRQGVPLPVSRSLHIMSQLCDALSEAHREKVVHRDLKPGNIMLVRRGDNSDFVKLIDFGIVRVLDDANRVGPEGERLTDIGMLIGTTSYLAPEYIHSQTVDARIDIYAMGVLCYELIAGRRPFENESRIEVLKMHLTTEPKPLTEIQDGRIVPPNLNQVVLRALAKNPLQRFQTAKDFKKALIEAALPLMDDDTVATTTKQSGIRLQSAEDVTVIEPIRGQAADPPHIVTAPAVIERQPPKSETAPRSSRPQLGLGIAVGIVVTALTIIGTVLGINFLRDKPESPERAQSHVTNPPPETVITPEHAAGFPTVTLKNFPTPPVPRRAAFLAHGDRSDRRPNETSGVPPQKAPSVGKNANGTVTAKPTDNTGRTKTNPVDPPPVTPVKKVRVTVLAKPYGKVYWGRRLLGSLQGSIRLKPGRHCFRAVHPTLGKKRQCAYVGPKRKNLVVIKLK